MYQNIAQEAAVRVQWVKVFVLYIGKPEGLSSEPYKK